MKPSEKKKNVVIELIKLGQEMNPDQLYCWPKQPVTRNWLAEMAAVLKQLDEGDYQKFTTLSKIISITEKRENRKYAAYEIDSFIRNKVAEYKRQDYSYLDKDWHNMPLNYKYILKCFGENFRQIFVGLLVTIIGGLALALIWGIGK